MSAATSPIVIADDADLVLHIHDPQIPFEAHYHCSSDALRNAGDFFKVLLCPAKFSTGIAVEKSRNSTSDALPVVSIAELLPPNSKTWPSINEIIQMFLTILHGQGLHPSTASRVTSLVVVAQIASVAEIFASLDVVTTWFHQLMRSDAFNAECIWAGTGSRVGTLRLQLYVGLLLKHPIWVQQCSASLILEGSTQHTSNDDVGEDIEHAVPWNNLPRGVEEEIPLRREYILDSISSIQLHLVTLYSLGTTQCRNVLEASKECDSFALGEATKFFLSKGTVKLHSAFTKYDAEPYQGNIRDLIQQLKDCPLDQIDSTHFLCGIGERLLDVLGEVVKLDGRIGICLECWEKDRGKASWLPASDGSMWPLPGNWFLETPAPMCEWHDIVKSMFTSEERDWTKEV